MKILNNIEIPEEVMKIFTKWCELVECSVTVKSFEVFANDCYLEFKDTEEYDENGGVEGKGFSEDWENLQYNGWNLFSVESDGTTYYDRSSSIIEILENKLNENIKS